MTPLQDFRTTQLQLPIKINHYPLKIVQMQESAQEYKDAKRHVLFSDVKYVIGNVRQMDNNRKVKVTIVHCRWLTTVRNTEFKTQLSKLINEQDIEMDSILVTLN